MGAVSTGTALAVALLLGARGWAVLWVAGLLWFPCAVGVGAIAAWRYPPKLEPWDGRKIA